MPRPSRMLALIALAVLATSLGVGATHSAFSKTTSNPSNVVAGRPDWLAPTVGTTAIAKSAGCLDGFVKQSGTYYVYGNASDPSSNPTAGVANMTADVSSISSAAGSNTVNMTSSGGPWTVNGTGYSYRSAQLTASNPLSAGAKAWTVTATDAATPTANTSSASAGAALTVDNTAPAPTNVTTSNGGTSRRIDSGDTMTLTYGEQIDPSPLTIACGSTSANVTPKLVDGGGSSDTLQVWDSGNSSQLPFGTISLGRTDLITTGAGTTAVFSGTMSQSGGALTVSITSTPAASVRGANSGANIAWTATSGSAYDRAGNTVSGSFTQSDNAADF